MNKTARIVIVLVVLALLVWPLWTAANWLAERGVYEHFVDSLSEKIGWNKYLIQALVLVGLAPFFYAARSFLSLSKARRQRGAILMTTMAVAYNLFLYFATKDTAFGFGKGEVLQYYGMGEHGPVIYNRPGFDPATGQKLKPVTPEVVRELNQLREGPPAKVDPAGMVWFSPYTSAPQLWYYRFPDGQLEFYNRPGAHPQTGDPLSPVTKELFLSWRAAHEGSVGRASASQAVSPAGAATLPASAPHPKIDARMENFRKGLVAGSGNGGTGLFVFGHDEAGQEGADALLRRLQGYNVNAFRAGVLQREGFGPDLYSGEAGLLREAMAVTRLGALAVAEVTVLCEKRSQLDPDLLSCDLTAVARKFDAQGNPSGSASARGTGAGFSRADALEQAAERAASALGGLAVR